MRAQLFHLRPHKISLVYCTLRTRQIRNNTSSGCQLSLIFGFISKEPPAVRFPPCWAALSRTKNPTRFFHGFSKIKDLCLSKNDQIAWIEFERVTRHATASKDGIDFGEPTVD